MAIRIIDLTREMRDGMETYPGDVVGMRLDRLARPEAHGFNLSRFAKLSSHCGTHLDAPLHFVSDGSDVASLPLRLFPAVVLPAQKKAIGPEAFSQAGPLDGRAVLLHTGWDSRLETPTYYRDAPFLTPEAARLLVEKGVGLIGIDSPSVDPFDSRDYPVHRILLGAGIPFVEGLVRLGEVARQPGALHFLAFPLKVKGAEASPVRAVALFLDAE